MANSIVWADIPVIDLERAKKFYEAVLNITLKEDFPGVCVLPHDNDSEEVGGCIYDVKKTEQYEQQRSLKHEPSSVGLLLYLRVDDVDKSVKAAEKNHGKVLATEDTPWGRRAVMIDSEGNRIAVFKPVPKDQMPKY